MTAKRREILLDALSSTVTAAAAFLAKADTALTDGHQTVRGLLANSVFWHEQYVAIAHALLDGREPELMDEPYAQLDAIARNQFRNESNLMLAARLDTLNQELIEVLRRLPDWSVAFPDRENCKECTVERRVEKIEAYIRNSVNSLRRAEPKQNGVPT